MYRWPHVADDSAKQYYRSLSLKDITRHVLKQVVMYRWPHVADDSAKQYYRSLSLKDITRHVLKQVAYKITVNKSNILFSVCNR